jgi:hypothetical protein
MADTFDYGSSDALIRHIKERADDIDAIWIVFDNAVKIRRHRAANQRWDWEKLLPWDK